MLSKDALAAAVADMGGPLAGGLTAADAWLAGAVPPPGDDEKARSLDAPPLTTELAWIYGGASLGGAPGPPRLAYSGAGDRVYASGCACVVYSAAADTQMFYAGHHAANVTCVAANADRTLVASGDADGSVRVWSALTAQNCGTAPRAHRQGRRIVALAWAPSSR